MNKSAITDHVAKENHVINWSGAKILERERHRKTRQVKESIKIRKEPTCMNRDGGAYSLLTAYDRLLVTCSTSTSRDQSTSLMKLAVGERNVATNLGINSRLCQRILF